PLANEAGPFLNGQFNGLFAGAKGGGLIAAGGGSKQVQTIERPGRKRNGLAAWGDSIRLAGSCGGQTETDARIVDYARQHLGRQCLTLRCGGSVQGAIEAALGRPALVRGDRGIVVQCHLLRLRGGQSFGGRSETYGEGVELKWRE